MTKTVSSRKTVFYGDGWGGHRAWLRQGSLWPLSVRPPEAGNVAPTAGARGWTETVSSFHPPRTLEKEEE